MTAIFKCNYYHDRITRTTALHEDLNKFLGRRVSEINLKTTLTVSYLWNEKSNYPPQQIQVRYQPCGFKFGW
jgi:hypothetical protein